LYAAGHLPFAANAGDATRDGATLQGCLERMMLSRLAKLAWRVGGGGGGGAAAATATAAAALWLSSSLTRLMRSSATTALVSLLYGRGNDQGKALSKGRSTYSVPLTAVLMWRGERCKKGVAGEKERGWSNRNLYVCRGGSSSSGAKTWLLSRKEHCAAVTQ